MNVTIVKKLKDQNVFAGEQGVFEVKLSRNDAIGIWKHNDEVLQKTKRYIKIVWLIKNLLVLTILLANWKN